VKINYLKDIEILLVDGKKAKNRSIAFIKKRHIHLLKDNLFDQLLGSKKNPSSYCDSCKDD
jgi:hypothetical protein